MTTLTPCSTCVTRLMLPDAWTMEPTSVNCGRINSTPLPAPPVVRESPLPVYGKEPR